MRPAVVAPSCLCKKLKGAVSPIFVEAVEDGINDSVHALDVGKHHHRSSPSSHLHEAALNGIDGMNIASANLNLLPEFEALLEEHSVSRLAAVRRQIDPLQRRALSRC